MGKHYVPQEYLRAFAIDGRPKHVWMFDKKKESWSAAAIDKIAQERDYFTPEVEAALARQVESPGHAVLKRLRGLEHLVPGDREALSLYIAVMIKRVPRSRRKAHELLPEVLESTITDTRQEFTEVLQNTNPDRLKSLLDELDRVAAKYRKATPQSVVDQINTPTVAKEMVDAIERMVWRLVLRPTKASPFITSDHPAFFFDAYGVGSPKAELTFPLSPDMTLMGSHQGEARSMLVAPATKDIAKEINRRVAGGAERFVFSSVRAQWIETLTTRANPFLSRIRW